MPTIYYNGNEIECKKGDVLRDVLLGAGETPHNGKANYLNCCGFGTCGTCAIEIIEGEAGSKTTRESWRLNFLPHDESDGLRLSCQITVQEDLKIQKYPGFWGQHISKEPLK